MSVYKPTMRHLREVLLYYFNSNESAAEAHRMLVHAYGKDIISLRTCERNFRRFRSGDFYLNRPTFKRLNKERAIEDLVRLRLENPGITQAEMAAKVGMSRMTVSRYLKSQEYQNELKKLQQDQSSIPLERTTLKRKHRELEDEKLVRLIPEYHRMSQDELAKQLEMNLPTTSKVVNTQKIQNKLKEKVLEPSSTPKKRRISRTPSTESEHEELEHFIDEFPGVTPEELAKIHDISISQAERIIDPSKIENE